MTETPSIIATESTRSDFMQVGEEFKIGQRKFVCLNHWTGQTIVARRTDKIDTADYFFTQDEIPVKSNGKPRLGRIYVPEAIRKAMMDTSGHACSVCGATEFLDIHHIDKNRANNSFENLMVVCFTCHTKMPKHEHYARAAKIRLNWKK